MYDFLRLTEPSAQRSLNLARAPSRKIAPAGPTSQQNSRAHIASCGVECARMRPHGVSILGAITRQAKGGLQARPHLAYPVTESPRTAIGPMQTPSPAFADRRPYLHRARRFGESQSPPIPGRQNGRRGESATPAPTPKSESGGSPNAPLLPHSPDGNASTGYNPGPARR